jgi:hypothetical protein
VLLIVAYLFLLYSIWAIRKVAGLRKELIRGVAVLSFEYLPAQNRARELGVLSLIAKQLEWDPMNQYIREWSIFAFRILEYNYQGTLES